MSIRFRFDWVEAPFHPDKLVTWTMAGLSLEAQGETVTSVRDQKNNLRNHVVVPLIYVAEWLIRNWWHIFCEIGDIKEQKSGFESRHNLALAGNGFVLPNLVMIPSQEKINLRWKRYKPRYAAIAFLDEGETSVEREELEAQFRDLVEAVFERLRGEGSVPEDLEREWTTINALDPEEREFCRSAALLGVDPFDVPDSLAAAIVRFCEKTAPSLRDDALAAGSAESLPQLSEWVAWALQKLEKVENGNEWANIREKQPRERSATPWEKGYDLARFVRRELDAGHGRFDFDSSGSTTVYSEEKQSPSLRVEGLVATDRPACVTVPRGETGKRFLLGRALGDYLSRSEPGPSLLSTLATSRQAMSRAFSAEFLAPAESIRRRLNNGFVEAEEVDDLVCEFGVSSEVIRRQIENHQLGTVVGW